MPIIGAKICPLAFFKISLQHTFGYLIQCHNILGISVMNDCVSLVAILIIFLCDFLHSST